MTALAEEIRKAPIRKRNTVFTDDFSRENWEDTYQYRETDRDVNDTHLRVAIDLASVEETEELQAYWADRFADALEDFKFVPGGRITSNAGTGLKGTTYINCFVSGPEGEYQDSMEGILGELTRQALILKSEGGYGVCADFMRPRGSFIHAIGNETPGAVEMLRMWDTQSAVITQGSGKKATRKKGKKKIRKGAQMVTMSCWHPDIEEFITKKQQPGMLTKFNMSVLITDEFMEAVENCQTWRLEFPDFEASADTKREYNKSWNGDLKSWKSKGLPIKVYREYEDANELWDLIMESTYNRNEPGVLFVDTINSLNNLYYEEFINATNPCGEQVLPPGGVCLLGSLNLTQFINFEANDWDYEKLAGIIPTAIRFMDNVNDRTLVPLDAQKRNLKEKRRVGLGILGYASALIMLKIRYGSEEALAMTEKLMDFIMNQAYQASALLAKEKGAFPLYDSEKYLAGEFVKKLSRKTLGMIREHGLRNSHLLSIQPTGNSSVFANNVSGGLEPVFMPDYIRTAIQACPPDGLELPINMDWELAKADNMGDWQWATEGDDNILVVEFEDDVYKMDSNRGLTKEVPCRDYAVRLLDEKGEWDPEAHWAASTDNLLLEDHISTMKVFSKYIDSAMSKTVNLAHEYPYEDFKRLYKDVHATGTIKGCTTYREGTMASVLSAESTKKEGIVKTDAPGRPEALACDIHHLTYKSEKWIVIVGLWGSDPYEVFAFKTNGIELPKSTKKGTLSKRMVRNRGKYDLECDSGLILKDVAKYFDVDEEETVTRCISMALRHGVDIEYVVDQLLKAHGTIASFNKVIARTLKKYMNGEIKSMKCLDCGSSQLKMMEGCFMCADCGMSKCQ